MDVRHRWLNRYRTGCLIAIAAIAASFGWHREAPGREADRDADQDQDRDRDDDAAEDPGANDYFYLQRRLPDGRIGLQQHARALAHARLKRAAQLMATSDLAA